MRVRRIQVRDFRNYEAAEVELADGLTVIAGPNGGGKTNLLEAVYFGCTAHSPRTSNERELVRRGGDGVARVVLVKGAPAVRRAHLDQVVAALWPSRAGTRAAYSRALSQRNALVARIRAG